MALPMRLGLVVAIADRRCTVATGTTYALRPAMVAHQFETLRLVQQRREIDQIGYGGDPGDRRTNQMASSSDQIRDLQPLLPPLGSPLRNPTRATRYLRGRFTSEVEATSDDRSLLRLRGQTPIITSEALTTAVAAMPGFSCSSSAAS